MLRNEARGTKFPFDCNQQKLGYRCNAPREADGGQYSLDEARAITPGAAEDPPRGCPGLSAGDGHRSGKERRRLGGYPRRRSPLGLAGLNHRQASLHPIHRRSTNCPGAGRRSPLLGGKADQRSRAPATS